jgi:hypothetical protein
MLKKALFSPARPLRAETRFSPGVVLSRPSPRNIPPVIELSWQLGVGGWKRSTLQSPSSLRPSWDAILSILRVGSPVKPQSPGQPIRK